MSEELREAEDRRLDWGLAEIAGAQTPPDLAPEILARLRGGDTGRPGGGIDGQPPAAKVRGFHYLVAALVLAGVAVLWLVAGWSPPPADWAAPGVQDPQSPPQDAVPVIDEEEIATLPRDTRNVRIHRAKDEWIRLLVERCPSLERLDLSSSVVTPPNFSDAGLKHVAKLANLRELNLGKCIMIRGEGLRHLAALPVLESLTLSRVSLYDEHFEHLLRLPSLESLDLSDNQDFGDEAMEYVVRIPGLRSLSLRRCSQLESSSLMRLARLTQIEELDLHGISSWNYPLKTGQLVTVINAIDENVLEMLAQLPRLHTLDLSETLVRFDSLGRFPALRRLSLRGCQGVSAEGIAGLGQLDRLELLDLGGGAAVLMEGAVVAGGRIVEEADVRYRRAGPQVTDQALMGLATLTSLKTLRIDNGLFTSMGLQAVTDMTRLEELDLSNNLEIVDAALGYLPRSIRRLDLSRCPNLGDPALKIAAERFADLEELDVSHCSSITEHGLADVLDGHQLTELSIARCSGVGADLFPQLLEQTRLQRLDTSGLSWWKLDHGEKLLEKLPQLELIEAAGTEGVPFLKDIPLLDTLFRKR